MQVPFSMAEPQLPSTPGDDSPPRGNGLEDEGLNVGYTPNAGSPVSLAPPPPPGWGEPPVLPGAGTRSYPIGGMENVSKLFSHIYIYIFEL